MKGFYENHIPILEPFNSVETVYGEAHLLQQLASLWQREAAYCRKTLLRSIREHGDVHPQSDYIAVLALGRGL